MTISVHYGAIISFSYFFNKIDSVRVDRGYVFCSMAGYT